MPVTIKTSEMSYKDNLGNYHGINAIAEKKIADQIDDLDAAIAAQESRIATDISTMQAAADNIESERQTMIASIASVAGQGTDTTLTQSGVAADAKSAGDKISDLKSALNRSVIIPGENKVSVSDFTANSQGITTTKDTTNGTITVTSSSDANYACAQTADTFIAANLIIGRKYRVHAKATKVSGNSNPHLTIRGINGQTTGDAAVIDLNGGEGFVDFVADQYMKRVTLYVSYGSSTNGSVTTFSEIWLKEYNPTGIDYESREEIEAVHKDINNICVHNASQKANLYIDDAANDMPFTSLGLIYDYDENGITNTELFLSGKNILGGEFFANRIKKETSTATIDTVNKTVTFSGAQIRGKTIFKAHFKENSQYTIILYGKNLKSGGSKETNITIIYTDGTTSSSSIEFESSTENSYAVFTSTTGKTIDRIQGNFVESSTVLYYEQCGLFEGIVAVADFEAYIGKVVSYNIGSVVNSFYGGSVDFITGKVISTKQSDGTDLNPPVEYDITTQFVTSLYEINIFMADADEVFAEYIADPKIYINKTANEASSFVVYNPDNYEGTDSEKLQQCFDALANVGGNICITRTYTLTEDLIINNDSENKRFITVYGLGKDAKIDCGSYRITGPRYIHRYGGVFWNNLQFYGTSIGIDAGILIRMWFLHCSFRGFTRVFSVDKTEQGTEETGRYIQTLYLSDCAIKGCGTAVYIHGNGVYNMSMHHCLIENATYGFNNVSGSMMGVRIDNCLFEGISTTGIYIGGPGASLTISNNYFETVPQCIYFGDQALHRAIDIRNNYFVTRGNPGIYIDPASSVDNNILKGIIDGNTLLDTWHTSAPLVSFTTMPAVQQPWIISNNYPNTVENAGRFIVGSNNVLADETGLDNLVIDGTYTVDGKNEIIQVISAGLSRVQMKFVNSDGLSFTWRIQDLTEDIWSDWN